MKQLKINKVFEDLIPPLAAEELKQLEDNVLAHGIRDAIVVWNDTIVDGHNRYKLAQDHALDFSTVSMEFDSEDSAALWIIDNQMGRRNLTDFVKLELQGKKAQVLIEHGRKAMSVASQEQVNRGNRHKKLEGLSTMDKPSRTEPAHNTQQVIAETLGWGTGKVARGQYVIKHAPEEMKEQLRSNEVTINEAYQSLKRQEKEQQHQHKFETETIPAADQQLIDLLNAGQCVVLNVNTNIHAMQYAKSIGKFELIDRFSDWGNPYILDKDGNRQFVCESYKVYFERKLSLKQKVSTLKGKALGCHCYPNECHGDHLKNLANADDN